MIPGWGWKYRWGANLRAIWPFKACDDYRSSIPENLPLLSFLFSTEAVNWFTTSCNPRIREDSVWLGRSSSSLELRFPSVCPSVKEDPLSSECKYRHVYSRLSHLAHRFCKMMYSDNGIVSSFNIHGIKLDRRVLRPAIFFTHPYALFHSKNGHKRLISAPARTGKNDLSPIHTQSVRLGLITSM